MEKKIILTILCFFIVSELGICYLLQEITPLKLKNDIFTFQRGENISKDIHHYVNANELVLNNTQLDLSLVSSAVGVYQAHIIYNEKKYPFRIQIIDTIKPKMKLIKAEWSILVNEKINARDLVKDIEDASSTTVYFLNNDTHEKKETLSYLKEGSYVEKVIVEDSYHNVSSACRVIIKVNKKAIKPSFEGVTNTFIKLGESFDLLKGVKAIDEVDGDITSLIKVKGSVNNKKIGDYVIEYSVKNSKGLETKVKRIITVE